ncbi:MAG: site-specific DNA-methyltransferase [Anaerolineaceae bacterium]|nr:site-specific DNA-methyltransferase [Anaerolineaceae bacterium]
MSDCIHFGDNLDVLSTLPARHYRLIYIDPPFNTGRQQRRKRLRTVRDQGGDRSGFQGKRYRSEVLAERAFDDEFDDYLNFLRPRLEQARRVLAHDGSLFFHIDYREVHYCKVLLDSIFGRDCFMNEIIWAYDYGGRSKSRWPAKHDNILWYVMDPDNFVFNYDAIDRIPYMAPGLVTPEKAGRGKTPTDVWWLTIVSPTGREKTGYPTQKPLKLLERIIAVHSDAGDQVLDFFAGSGTTGVAANSLGRHFTLIDNNPDAIQVMQERLGCVAGESGRAEANP